MKGCFCSDKYRVRGKRSLEFLRDENEKLKKKQGESGKRSENTAIWGR